MSRAVAQQRCAAKARWVTRLGWWSPLVLLGTAAAESRGDGGLVSSDGGWMRSGIRRRYQMTGRELGGRRAAPGWGSDGQDGEDGGAQLQRMGAVGICRACSSTYGALIGGPRPSATAADNARTRKDHPPRNGME
jgi:hypothetical protein